MAKASLVLGNDAVPWLTSNELRLSDLSDLRTEICGDDLFVEGYVHRVD